LREYYDPYTGAGMGAREFSWSALVMEMIAADPEAPWSHVGPGCSPHNSQTGVARFSG
jgi:hypothetical protein